MLIATLRRRYVHVLAIGLLACLAALALPTTAGAQGFVNPFIGFNYGGDSGCPTATGCEDKNNNFGVSAGKLGAIAGVEVELGYARDFFGDTETGESSVLTLMTNVLVGPKVGAVQPYLLGGLGLIKTHVEFTTGSILDSSNNFGWDVGGGVIVMFGQHIGVRGDIRRFKSFQNTNILGLITLGSEKVAFNRANIGAVFAW